MSHNYPLTTLGEIFEIARGGSPRPIQNFITEEPDGLNWISIKDASNSDKYISKTKLKIRKEGLSKSRLVKPGDFLLTNSMSFGRPYIMNTTGCIHDGWLVLSSDPEKVFADYFYHLLGSETMYRKFAALAGGAVVKNLNIDLVKGVEIPLPPLKEQKRIAAILDKADAIRRKRQQAIQLADEFLRAVFLDMFGDPVTNSKGWDTVEFGDICRQVTVGIVVKPASYYVEQGVPAIRSLNIKNNKIKEENYVYFSEEDNANALGKTRVYAGDLVVVRSGQPGATAVIPDHLDGINAIDVLIVRPNASYVESDYLSYFLNSSAGKQIVMAEQRGQIQKHLNVGSLSKSCIPLPSLDVQHSFINIMGRVRKFIDKSADESNPDLFQSLSHKAFSGVL